MTKEEEDAYWTLLEQNIQGYKRPRQARASSNDDVIIITEKSPCSLNPIRGAKNAVRYLADEAVDDATDLIQDMHDSFLDIFD